MNAWMIAVFDGQKPIGTLYWPADELNEARLKELLARLVCQHESALDIARATSGKSTLLDVFVDRTGHTPIFICGSQRRYRAVKKDVNPELAGTYQKR